MRGKLCSVLMLAGKPEFFIVPHCDYTIKQVKVGPPEHPVEPDDDRAGRGEALVHVKVRSQPEVGQVRGQDAGEVLLNSSFQRTAVQA